ncbi:ATPase [Aciduliprofundum sp. MAR08-339]|uniref:BREX system ATP-binding domain-containing protein n=1 Tax=Aciduliprofundum sp. (strain MAR08-339) TaxID=673860 RepID=UPI0002A48F56|nr:ATPase [Aciduliprofundum sp. MAR08-339]
MQLIEHRTYGKGKILRERYGGFELYVEFEDGIRRWVRKDEVRFLSEAPILVKHKHTKRVLSEKQFKARQIIEALRLGIVPHEYVEEFTFGREEEINEIKKWLNNEQDGTFIIRGDYGSGKTHLLEYIYSISLNNNWMVSLVEIGRNENPFFRPYQIYQQIIKNIKWKKNGKYLGFRDFIREVINSNKSPYLENHIYFKKLIDEFKKRNTWLYQRLSEEIIWEWIEGEYNWYRPSLYKSGTAANIYCYILNGISWAAYEILKMRGFLILFDEAENISEYDYKYQSEKGMNFIKGIILLSNNFNLLLTEKIENLKGKNTGLTYCGFPRNNPIRFAWKLPSHLKVLFAFTPIWDYKNKIDIGVISNDAFKELLNKIIKYYKDAYEDISINYNSELLFDKIPNDKTRKFIKGVVEVLDLIRFYPNKSMEELLR